MRSQLLAEEFQKEEASPWETAGKVLGMAMAGPMVDTMVDSLSPIQCIKLLYRTEIRGENLMQAQKRAAKDAKTCLCEFAAAMDKYHDKFHVYTESTKDLEKVGYSFPDKFFASIYLNEDGKGFRAVGILKGGNRAFIYDSATGCQGITTR